MYLASHILIKLFFTHLKKYTTCLGVTFSIYDFLMSLSIPFYRLFNEYEEYDFARTGSMASEKVGLMCHFYATSMHMTVLLISRDNP